MKKLFIYLSVLFFATLLACQEDNIELLDQPIAEQDALPQMSDDAYVERHYKNMKTLAKGLLYKSQDPNFRSLLYSKVGERFDGETNVLIELLAEDYGKDKLYSEIQKEFVDHNVNETFEGGLRAFDVDETEQQLLPHIAVAFFEDDAKLLNVRKGSTSSTPVILIENPLKETDAEPGYTLDKDGNFIELKELVTEEFAKKNEVWVLAQNERVGSLEEARLLANGKGDEPIDKCPGCPPNPKPNPGPCFTCPPTYPPALVCNDGVVNGQIPDQGIAIKLKKLRIIHHKESWYRFGSEINMAITSTSGKSGSGNYWTLTTGVSGGGYYASRVPQYTYGFGTIKRDDIKDGKQFNYNQTVTATKWDLQNSGGNYYTATYDWKAVFRNAKLPVTSDFIDARADYLVWAIYEKDIAPSRTARVNWVEPIDLASRNGFVVFTSLDSEYQGGHFSASQNNKYYPCKYNTYTLYNNKDNYFFFETERGTRSANFGYDK